MSLSFPVEPNKFALKDIPFEPWRYEHPVRKELSYTLSLPKSLKLLNVSNDQPDANSPVRNSSWFRTEDKHLDVLIQSSFIKEELILEHYYKNLARLSNESILYSQNIKNNNNQVHLLTQRKIKNGENWISRRTGFKIWNGIGAYAITIYSSCKIDNYHDTAEVMYSITSSLKPLMKPEYTLAEMLRLYSQRYPGDFSTYIPFSWHEAQHDNNTKDEFRSFFRKKIGSNVTGILSIRCISCKKAKLIHDALRYFQQAYQIVGMEINQIPISASRDVSCFKNLNKGNADLLVKRNSVERMDRLTFYIAKHKGNWFYIDLYGPSEAREYEAWAVNDAALKLVIGHFRVA